MKQMFKAYKYRIQPTEKQITLLNKHFGSVRYVYNHFLNARKEQYRTSKKSDNYVAQCKVLTSLKTQEDTIWLKEINSQTLQASLKNLEAAYLNFFRGNTQFPKFKSRRSKNSFKVPQAINIKNNKIYIPKFREGIQFIQHRELQGEIRNCTFSRTPTGKFYISILTQVEHQQYSPTGRVIGIDLGIKDFVITSNGSKYKNHRYTKIYEQKLKVAQRHLSRKKQGSQRYENQRLKVAKIHEKISNSRTDNLHKLSTNLIKSYDLICLEDLHVKGMVKNHKLAKHISDCSWGTFVAMLEYKAAWNDKQIVKVNRFFPSSKTCSKCNYINQSLTLSDRKWTCIKCNVTHDRDINAAKNILVEGINLLSAGTVEYTNGDDVRLSKFFLAKQLSEKLEA